MSHFTTLVITSLKTKDTVSIEKQVEELLTPFDEQIQVQEYDQTCFCKGHIARMEAKKKADEVVGTIDLLRSQFWKIWSDRSGKTDDMGDSEYAKLMEEQDKAWKAHFKPWYDVYEHEFQNHSMRNEFDSDCTSCGGIGLYKSTYNPNSKWDWYAVGGRWDGSLHKDGKNIFPTRELLQNPFAILTPDGKWHEKGKMGWFASVSDEKDNWDEIAKGILDKYADNYAAVVDCHI
jgi:hypothetical protein